MKNIDSSTLLALSKKMGGGDNVSRLLSVLGKRKQFRDAIETNIGQELLKDLIRKIEKKLEKWLKGDADDEDRAELKAYQNLMDTWMTRLIKYNKDLERFDKLTN